MPLPRDPNMQAGAPFSRCCRGPPASTRWPPVSSGSRRRADERPRAPQRVQPVSGAPCARFEFASWSEGAEECKQGGTVGFGQLTKVFPRGGGLAAMPQDRFGSISRPAVVQEERVAVDLPDEAQSPERWCSPLAACGEERRPLVGQPVSHVVQQQIRVRTNALIRKLG